jgi:RNA polymerase sigma-70 factor (ECF subfamily)
LSADEQTLAKWFEASRPHLQGVAYRMLGSLPEADDAVQEAWLRLSRSDTGAVENLTGWLTTVVARICLDILRSRTSKVEGESRVSGEQTAATDPEREALLAESVGLALLVVLEALDPAERVAFVLHDIFAVPFEEVGGIVGRSPEAARQLASRARRRVRGAEPSADGFRPGLADQRRLVDAFLAALRSADFGGLVAVLGPEFVIRADATASPPGGSDVHGAETWAKQAVAWARGAKDSRPVLANGSVGVVLAPRGRLRRVLLFAFADGRIANIEIVGDPERLRQLDLSVLPD